MPAHEQRVLIHGNPIALTLESKLTPDFNDVQADAFGGENEKKTRVARAAEFLFSKFDFDAVSVRDIATEAGVNSALVGYYFGTKDLLYRALFERRYHLITAKRLRRLDAVRAKPDSENSLREIVRAWITPLLEIASTEDGKDFAALLARQTTASGDPHGVWRDFLEPSARRCLEALQVVFPKAPPEDLLQGYLWMIACVMSCIARTEREARLLDSIERVRKLPIRRACQLESFIVQGFMSVVASEPLEKTIKQRR